MSRRSAAPHTVLTDPALPSGSDRILAALKALDPDENHDVVLNLQGDLPFFDRGTWQQEVELGQ